MNTKEQIEEEIKEILRRIMPRGSETRVAPTLEDIRIGVFWPLQNDPERPNKMSKIIAVTVTYEDACDFAQQTDEQKEAGLKRLRDELKRRLESFDPEHNNPRHKSPPVEEWRIGALLVVT